VSRAVPVTRVDVFADRPFAGNPATAILDADGLSEPGMQAVATEMRTAGTAFVAASTRGGADFSLRKFTPTREVAYSGHTTIGAVHALLEAGRLAGERVVFDTTQGLLPVAIERRPGGVVAWLEPPVPACRGFTEPLDEVLDALGLRRAGVGGWAPLAVTPDTDLLLPVKDLETLRGLAPDMGRLAALGTRLGLRAFCAVSPETVEPASASHCRFFAPQFGIPEDIVTGSVHSSIGVWLYQAGRLPAGDGGAFTAEQGDTLGRPGRLQVEVEARGGQVSRVRVGGRAVVIFTGELRLP